MEFGIFLNGYLPGPAAHDTDLEHEMFRREAEYTDPRRPAQLEVRLVRRAPRPHRVQPHVGPRGDDRLLRPRDRAHPPRLGHHEPPAGQGPPRARRRARRHARPPHRTSATSSAPAAAPAATRSRRSASWTPTRPSPCGTRSSARSRACGSSATTRSRASTSRCRRRTTSSRSPTARGTRRSGWRAATRRTFAKAGAMGIGAIAFNFEPIHNLKGRVEAYKEAIQSPPTRSASSRTTT